MVSSARRAIAGIFIVLAFVSAHAQQSTPEKLPSASISGTVTLKGKPIAGIVVIASNNGSRGWGTPRYRAITDQLGNYSITKLPAGNYEIEPAMQSFIHETMRTQRSLLISDGETVEKVDFALLRGGVITGRITDADGQPLIEEEVSVEMTDGYGNVVEPVQTDDRGVYRFFGLQPGKYKISAGQEEGGGTSGARPLLPKTFHPSAIEPEKATIVEVKEGSESTNIDVVMTRPFTSFTVSGRVVDGETGKPLAKIQFGIYRMNEQSSYSVQGGTPSNAAGEFRFSNLVPGTYYVHVLPGNNVRSETVSFEVIDRDIKDLIIKTKAGATLSGVVVFEGSEGKVLDPGYTNIMVFARFEDPGPGFHLTPRSIAPDGTFTISGLPAGKASFQLFQVMRQPGAPVYDIVRVERNGMPQPDGIEVKEGENIAGLRLVVKAMNGKIRGVVKDENGAPVFQWVSLSLVRFEDDPMSAANSISGNQVDSRGRFFMDGIAPGSYVISVEAMLGDGRQVSAKQQVTVTDNTVTEVTLTLKDKDPNPF